MAVSHFLGSQLLNPFLMHDKRGLCGSGIDNQGTVSGSGSVGELVLSIISHRNRALKMTIVGGLRGVICPTATLKPERLLTIIRRHYLCRRHEVARVGRELVPGRRIHRSLCGILGVCTLLNM